MGQRIFPSITTHAMMGNSWRSKVCEIAPLGLREVGLFVTGLTPAERELCYEALLQVRSHHAFTIPFVHAVTSMVEDEYWFLMDTFGTERFNLHPTWQFPLEHHLSSKVRAHIYIENSASQAPLTEEDLDGFAGLCIDLSHLGESQSTHYKAYESVVILAQNRVVGANHISAVQAHVDSATKRKRQISLHVATVEEDFSYLSLLPSHCVAPLCAIELENPLADQVRYLSTIASQLAEGAVNSALVAVAAGPVGSDGKSRRR